MNLTEYLSQEKPIQMPTVYLNKTEYIVGIEISDYFQRGARRIIRKQIFIHAFPGIEYVQEGLSNVLYTTDEDGNPKKPSCFRI